MTALIDAACLTFNILGARVVLDHVPASIWLLFPLWWLAFLAFLVAPLFLIRQQALRSRAFLATLLLAGPGLLVLVRLIRPLRPELEYHGILGVVIVLGVISIVPVGIAFRYSGWLLPRLSAPVGAIAIALFAASLSVARATVAPDRGMPPPENKNLPNVVLIFLDTLRYDRSGGPDEQERSVALPNLEWLNREGMAFENAYSPSPWTLPSHVSILTGLSPQQHRVSFERQRYSAPNPTLAERLARRGYSTAAVFANFFLHDGSGLDRGFQVFHGPREVNGVCWTSAGLLISRFSASFLSNVCRYPSEDITAKAVKVLDRLRQPYFLALNYVDPHDPYYAPRNCRPSDTSVFDSVRDPVILDQVNWSATTLSSEDRRRLLRLYDVAIQCMDQSLGVLFSAIRQRPDAAHTIIVVVGDHGEQFGEHGLMLHGNSLYRQVLRVPLIIHGGSIRGGQRFEKAVSTTSLFSFLLAVTKGQLSTPELLGTFDWPRVISLHQPGSGPTLPPRIAEYAWSIIEHPYHLIYRDSGTIELFNYQIDPEELENLKEDRAAAPVLRRMLDELGKLPSLKQLRQLDEQSKTFYSLGYLR